MSTNKTSIVKDMKAKSITVSREFQAPLAQVWRCYTEAELLDQWWGPAPWRAETKHLDFSVGGYWHYAMVGPANEKHWARMNYLAIDNHKSYQVQDAFADENGNLNREFPISKGTMSFTKTAKGTKVDFHQVFPTETDLQKLVELGFQEGISQCLDQLEALLAKSEVLAK